MLKKCLSVVMIVAILFSFAIPTFAVDYNGQSIDLDVATITQSNSSVNTVNVTDYTSTMVVEDLTMSGVFLKQFYNTNSNYYSSGFVKTTVISAPFYVNKNHSYTVDFYSFLDSAVGLSVRCYIYVFDGNGNNLQTISLYEVNHLSAYNLKHHSFDFCLDDYSLPSGYSLRFGADFFVSDSHSYPFKFRCSDFNYVDNDDSSGLLNSLITAVGMVWSEVCDFHSDFNIKITSLSSSLSSNFANLNSTITSSCSDIVSSINSNFTSLSSSLSSNFANLNSTITSSCSGIVSSINNNFSSFSSLWSSGIQSLRDDLSNFFTGDSYSNESSVEDVTGVYNDFSQVESDLPGVNDANLDSVFSSVDVSSYNNGFLAINSIFDSLISRFSLSPVILFCLAIGLCTFLLGRRLKN